MNFGGDSRITRAVYAPYAFRRAGCCYLLPLLIVKDLKTDLAL